MYNQIFSFSSLNIATSRFYHDIRKEFRREDKNKFRNFPLKILSLSDLNKMRQLILFLLFFSLCGIIPFPAQVSLRKVKSLDERINDNRDIALSDPEQYYENAKKLLKEAIQSNDHRAELRLLGQHCWYFNRTMALEKALEADQKLEKKAIEYEDTYHEALAHQYLSHTFALSDLPDRSIVEFKKAIKLLNRLDPDKQDVRYLKMNACFTVANAYINKKDFREAVNVMLLANKEIVKFDDEKLKKQMLFLNYSNLGIGYEKFNIDSAEYYAKKSIELKTDDQELSTAQFQNYIVMGSIYKKKDHFPEAVDYYKKAEKIGVASQQELENMKDIYQGLIQIYAQTDSADLSKIYTQKSDAVQLEMEKSKNKSLHNIIENRLLEDKRTKIYIIAGSSAAILVLLGIIFYFKRRNRQLADQEKASQQYLKEIKQSAQEQVYDELVEMAKHNNPSFLATFLEKFPDFLPKLQSIHPKIVQTEVEFCALLKLNLGTKEIARYKNIEPRTVQNKKYLIRKKLNIPKEMDIYHWFSSF